MLKIYNVFKSINGEGIDIGMPAVFVRFAGCNLKCKWCFTKNTNILLNDFSTKTINNLVKGDILLGLDNRKIVQNKVLETMSRKEKILEIYFENKKKVKVTENHLFYNTWSNKRIKAKNLKNL